MRALFGARPEPPGGTRPHGHSPTRLWLYGLGMLGPVFYFVHRYSLRDHADKLLDIGKMSEYQRPEYTAFVVGLQLMFGLYVLAIFESRRLTAPQALPVIFVCGTAMVGGMVLMYPATAVDLFTYAVRSRLFTTYGDNPLIALFKDHPDDPWQHIAHGQWARLPSPYGPLWTLISAPITYWSGDRVVVALIGFKMLSMVSTLGGAWAIARILQASGSPHPATGALIYLWNPLVLWEGVGNGHNDVVMLLPVLLALLAWATHRDVLVIPLIVTAAMIKYVPLVILPLAMVAVWYRPESRYTRQQLVGWSLALSLLVVLVAVFPFYDLGAIRESVAIQADIVRMSLFANTWEYVREWGIKPDVMKRWYKLGVLGALVVMLVWQGCMLVRQPSRLPRAVFETLFLVPLLVTYFNAWYLIWAVGIAALLPLGWPAWRTIVWSASALAGYAVMIWLGSWWELGLGATTRVAVPVMFAGVLVLTLTELLWRGVMKGLNVVYTKQRRRQHPWCGIHVPE